MTPEQAQDILRGKNPEMCSAISPDRTQICVLPIGHDPTEAAWEHRSTFLDEIFSVLEEFLPRDTPRTIIGIRAGLSEITAKRGADVLRERLTALLALPADASGHAINEAVRICVRRCEALELERMVRRGEAP